MATACSVRIHGVVQGIGFRPFVFRLARANALAGWVLNGDQGVEILLEGIEEYLAAFVRETKVAALAAAHAAFAQDGPGGPRHA
jgi:hydrogenase maturation protein HypF